MSSEIGSAASAIRSCESLCQQALSSLSREATKKPEVETPPPAASPPDHLGKTVDVTA